MLNTHHSLPGEFILDNFIGGLNLIGKPFVKAFKSTSIAEAVELARLQEEQNLSCSQKAVKTPFYSQHNKAIQVVPVSVNRPTLLPAPSTKPQLLITKFQPKFKRKFRHIPVDVRAKKIAKGL